MKRFTKAHWEEITKAMDVCHSKATDLEHAVEEYNEKIQPITEQLETAVADYNASIADLTATYQEIATEGRSYFEDRSEKWAESEAGEQYSAWLDELEGLYIEEIDLDLPEAVEPPDLPDFEDTDWLPSDEPGGG